MKKGIGILFLLVLIIGGFFFFNRDESPKERDLLFKEVMKIHDDVMPKMADINRTKRGLKGILSQDSTITDSLKAIILEKMLELEKAEDAMNTWMREFDAPKSSDPDQKALDYLEKEKVRISEVSDLMLNALDSGNQLFDNLKK